MALSKPRANCIVQQHVGVREMGSYLKDHDLKHLEKQELRKAMWYLLRTDPWAMWQHGALGQLRLKFSQIPQGVWFLLCSAGVGPPSLPTLASFSSGMLINPWMLGPGTQPPVFPGLIKPHVKQLSPKYTLGEFVRQKDESDEVRAGLGAGWREQLVQILTCHVPGKGKTLCIHS